jgi:hypothetical protein
LVAGPRARPATAVGGGGLAIFSPARVDNGGPREVGEKIVAPVMPRLALLARWFGFTVQAIFLERRFFNLAMLAAMACRSFGWGK